MAMSVQTRPFQAIVTIQDIVRTGTTVNGDPYVHAIAHIATRKGSAVRKLFAFAEATKHLPRHGPMERTIQFRGGTAILCARQILPGKN